ncbi:hypothetical protein SAY86_020913 [Trapa natans]|uniref:Uncharacterized protein n=1 Tax=Trapa natans TaxID=22666 RepID=A0AAN7M9K2_TRANT|nr:hypothetical protein SAY86_020913 [Trapa natans]
MLIISGLMAWNSKQSDSISCFTAVKEVNALAWSDWKQKGEEGRIGRRTRKNEKGRGH